MRECFYEPERMGDGMDYINKAGENAFFERMIYYSLKIV